MSRSSKYIEPEEGVMGTSNLQLSSQKHRWGNNLNLELASDVGAGAAVLWDWTHNLWDLMLFPGRQCPNGVEL